MIAASRSLRTASPCRVGLSSLSTPRWSLRWTQLASLAASSAAHPEQPCASPPGEGADLPRTAANRALSPPRPWHRARWPVELRGSPIRPDARSEPCPFGPACLAVGCHGRLRLARVCLALVCGSPRCGSQPPCPPAGKHCQRRRGSARS